MNHGITVFDAKQWRRILFKFSDEPKKALGQSMPGQIVSIFKVTSLAGIGFKSFVDYLFLYDFHILPIIFLLVTEVKQPCLGGTQPLP